MTVSGAPVNLALELSRSNSIIRDDTVVLLEKTFRGQSSYPLALHGHKGEKLRRSALCACALRSEYQFSKETLQKSDGFVDPLFAMTACWKRMASEAQQSHRRHATTVCGLSLEN